MALANYADLLASVAGWLNRTDLTATIPDFIRLAEAEFNRSLRTIEMEGRATATLTSDAVAVPSDYIGLKSIKLGTTPLEYVAPGEAFDDDTTGTAARYTISDGQFFFRPAPSTGTVTIDYYQAIPALTASNTTNWLMTKHPDLYLFATCAQAEFYLVNDARVPAWKGRAEELTAQINRATVRETFDGHRLTPRLNVPTV